MARYFALSPGVGPAAVGAVEAAGMAPDLEIDIACRLCPLHSSMPGSAKLGAEDDRCKTPGRPCDELTMATISNDLCDASESQRQKAAILNAQKLLNSKDSSKFPPAIWLLCSLTLLGKGFSVSWYALNLA